MPLAAGGSVSDLRSKLERGVDFRVRVQAALELGKSKDAAARAPLEAALDDENAAVRAAAAAGLKVLGSKESVPALERHRKDPSAAVRSQIESTLTALRQMAARKKPEVLVQLGMIANGSRVKSNVVQADVERTSREKLSEIPGVEIVEARAPEPQPKSGKAKGSVPLVMMTGRVKQLGHQTQGDSVVYSASVEFIMHQMPGQAIKGVISGSARASGAASDARDRNALEELRRAALEAAIASALRNAPEAIRAAIR
jgi:plasmid stability protein